MTQTIPTTELEAVNVVLNNLGDAPVNTLTGGIPLEASKALATLREVSKEVQKSGWYFNIEYHSLAPDVNGYILLPKNTLKVRSDAEDRGTPVVQRDDKLYNMTPYNHGFVFDGAMKLELILGLTFDELPQTAKSYITYRAARVHQVRELGDQMNAQDDSSDEATALVELRAEQTRMAPYSMKDSYSVSAAISQRPTINALNINS